MNNMIRKQVTVIIRLRLNKLSKIQWNSFYGVKEIYFTLFVSCKSENLKFQETKLAYKTDVVGSAM